MGVNAGMGSCQRAGTGEGAQRCGMAPRMRLAQKALVGLLACTCACSLGFAVASRSAYAEPSPSSSEEPAAASASPFASSQIVWDDPDMSLPFVGNEVVLFAAPDAGEEDVAEAVVAHGGVIVGALPEVGAYQVRFASTMDYAQVVDLAANLAADPAISSAYPNMLFELDGLGEVSAGAASEGIVTDDAVWNVGWALRYSADNKATEYDEAGQLIYCADAPLTESGQLDYESLIAQDPSNPTPAEVEAEWRLPARWAYDAINLPQAWAVLDSELGTEPGAGVTVGIFDSAIYTDHEDLPEIATTQQDDVDWLETSHATRVAGIIGARANNGTGQYGGTVGVAYGSSLVSISTGAPSVEERADLAAEGSGLGSAFQYVYALTELAQSGAKVINCSNGLPLEDYIEPANNAQSDDHQWALDAIEQSNELIADTLGRLLDSGYDFVICKASGNYNSVDDLEFNSEETVGVEGGQNAALDVLSGIDDERLRGRIIVVGAV